MRRILECDRLDPIDSMHNNLNLMPLDTRRKYHSMTETYKILNGYCLVYLNNLFVHVSDIHSRNTRSVAQNRLYIPKCRLECTKRNFRYHASRNWNTLPEYVQLTKSVDEFKNLLLPHLVNNIV